MKIQLQIIVPNNNEFLKFEEIQELSFIQLLPCDLGENYMKLQLEIPTEVYERVTKLYEEIYHRKFTLDYSGTEF